MPDVTINVSKPAAYLSGGVVMIGRPDVMFSGDVGSQWTAQPQIVIPAPRRENRLVLVHTKVEWDFTLLCKDRWHASDGLDSLRWI